MAELEEIITKEKADAVTRCFVGIAREIIPLLANDVKMLRLEVNNYSINLEVERWERSNG